METTKERKAELLKMNYGDLQSQTEYKNYIEKVVFNKSCLMNEEVEYILKQSYEDNDAPFSYEDIPPVYYDEDEMKADILKVFEELTEDEDATEEEFKEEVESFEGDLYFINKPKDTLNAIRLYLNDCYEDELKKMIEDEPFLNDINLDDYERQTEVMQWFLMDERLLRQLEQRGELVLNDKYWGRQTFGQMLDMDGVIIEIFKEWWL